MSDPDRQHHIQTLRATPNRLRDALKGVPKSVLLWPPAPGKWSIQEIVVHMRDMERDAYLDRYRRILAEDEPQLPDIDGDVLALEEDYRSARLGDVVKDWKRLRRESLKTLVRTKADQWARGGVHPTSGRLSVDDLLRRHAVGNDEAHLAQIEAIKKRHALLGRLEAAPARLAKALLGFSAEALRRPPQPGKWPAVAIGCHVRDTDRVFAARVSNTAFTEKPAWWVTDNPRLTEKLRYADADPVAVAREFRRRREELVNLLRALPATAWQRTGMHPKRGEMTIEQVAEFIAGHDDHHIAQVEGLLANDGPSADEGVGKA